MKLRNHPRVEMLPPATLIPNPDNTNTHPDKQIVVLAGIIERFGFTVPIVIDQHNMVLAGHGRLEAAKRLKLDLVPVIRAAHLNDEERLAYAMADNRIAELSIRDEDILQSKLEILFDGGFDITAIGFSSADLDFTVIEEADARSATRPEEVELPDPEAKAIARLGDLWLLGEYRIFCGDMRDIACWEKLLGDDRADIVFSDPPFNVPVNGHVSGTGRHREFAFASGEMTPAEFTHFLRGAFRNCTRFSRSGSIHFHCMDWRHIREILDAADGVYHEFKQLIVWNKGTGGMGTFYRSQHELVFAFKAGKAKHTNNFGLGEKGRDRTNVVDYPGCNTFRKGRNTDLAAHATVKPTALVADFLLDCSNRGDLVVDPFLGSGTTLLAAHRTRRRGAGIEIDPLYVDTAIRRLTTASGLTATLAGDGRTFDEIAAARGAES